MHYSRLGARRVLEALMIRGGSATTLQIYMITHSLAVHTDIAALRAMLKHDYDYEDENEAVKAECMGRNETGHMIYRNTLREDVIALARALRAGVAQAPPSPSPLPVGEGKGEGTHPIRASHRSPASQSSRGAGPHQEVLFETSRRFKD